MAEEENLEALEEQKEALELDKLEVSAKPAKPKEPSVSTPAKSEEKPTPPGRWRLLLQSIFALIKNRTFLLSAVTGLLVGAAALLFVSSRPSPPQHSGAIADATGKIVYSVSSPIGLGHYVAIRISVPFKDGDEKRDLMGRLTKVKHELPRATTLPEVTESIRKRDLDALREQVVKIVCEVTGIPTEKLALEIESLN